MLQRMAWRVRPSGRLLQDLLYALHGALPDTRANLPNPLWAPDGEEITNSIVTGCFRDQQPKEHLACRLTFP